MLRAHRLRRLGAVMPQQDLLEHRGPVHLLRDQDAPVGTDVEGSEEAKGRGEARSITFRNPRTADRLLAQAAVGARPPQGSIRCAAGDKALTRG